MNVDLDTVKSKLAWINKPVNLMLIGLFVGAFTILALRVLLIKDHSTHYHANFALYINGQQDKFDSFTFYEEVAACTVDDPTDVKRRAHMHDENNSLVHVHDDGVTWGDFFANLGYTLGNKIIKTDNGIYIDGADGKKLTFILNGETATSIANKVIGSEDVLLIDYGDGASTKAEYDQIPKNSHEYNSKADPSTCSGSHKLTFGDRLKQALDLTK
jgi:hypothetical protein